MHHVLFVSHAAVVMSLFTHALDEENLGQCHQSKWTAASRSVKHMDKSEHIIDARNADMTLKNFALVLEFCHMSCSGQHYSPVSLAQECVAVSQYEML